MRFPWLALPLVVLFVAAAPTAALAGGGSSRGATLRDRVQVAPGGVKTLAAMKRVAAVPLRFKLAAARTALEAALLHRRGNRMDRLTIQENEAWVSAGKITGRTAHVNVNNGDRAGNGFLPRLSYDTSKARSDGSIRRRGTSVVALEGGRALESITTSTSHLSASGGETWDRRARTTTRHYVTNRFGVRIREVSQREAEALMRDERL